ncbi:MAG TPA: BatA and WFA domain-containing protein [Gemmatimonadaceae bacterium]|nr:BatA and WFA domain-containing protein [Gemmatimonadaceae bacterium]
MAFLAPLWLSLTVLAAVPVLLHLLRRNIGARVEFPAVRYLLSAERESSKDVRAKNLLLLLLRIVIVILLALAAARPMWTRGEGTPRALAIVLDNSLSTTAIVSGAPVLERLVTTARELRAASGSAERLWLITADGTVHTGPDAIDAALSRVIALPGAGQLDAAVRTALSLTQGAGADGGAVAILTDGQRSAWSSDIAAPASRVRVFVPRLEPPPNGAILSAVAQPQWWTPRGALELTVQAVRDSTAYRVAIGDNTLARGVIVRGAGDSLATLRLPLVGSGRGWQALDVTLEPSGVGADDHAIVPIVVGSAPAVRESAGEFAAAAVASLRENGRVRGASDVTVSIAPAASVPALPALILPPADAGGLPAANAALARLGIPWRFASEQRGSQVARAAQADLRGDTAIRVTQWFPLVAQPGAVGDTVAQVGSAVWMASGPKWIIVGSSLDPSSTTLPVRATFVPWLADAISNLASGTTAAVHVTAGARIVPPVGATELRSSNDSVRRAVSSAAMTAPPLPGLYFWLRGRDTIGAIGVRLDAGEPQLARASSAELTTRFGGTERAELSTDGAAFLRSVRQSGAARPMAVPLLWLALLAVLAEAWLSGRHRTRAAGSESLARTA